MKKLVILAAVFVVSMAFALAAMPSTNDDNRDNGWAHFNVLSTSPGAANIEFVSTRAFYSCFEYRTDGDTSQSTGDNYNGDITDGLYPFTCINDETTSMNIEANEYIEIRMVFGGEGDERFDWTRVEVPSNEQEVPEFGVIAGLAVLGVAGLFIYKKRN